MFPGGLKSISGQEMKNSNFRQKMDPVGQKSIFWSKSSIFQPKMVPTDLKSIFGRKMRNSNFRPKIDPGGQKSIFCQKVEMLFFNEIWPKTGP